MIGNHPSFENFDKYGTVQVQYNLLMFTKPTVQPSNVH